MSNNISLIVLNYNGKHLLKDYFDSLFLQTRIPDEIIMLDNNSTDDSVAFVKQHYPDVIIVESSKNKGTARGSNTAFKHAKGEYVIFQSNDMKLHKNCVKSLYERIKGDKSIGICTSILMKYTTDENGIHHVDNAGGIVDLFGFGMQKYPDKLLDEIPDEEEVFFSYGGSFIIPKKLFQKVGGYDDRFFTLNDDVDLSWRVRKLGYKVMYTKKSLIYHKVSATLGPLFNKPIKRFWSERNAMCTLLKNHNTLTLLYTVPIYLILLFGEIIYFLYRKRFDLAWADINAVMWNIKELPRTLQKRITIQHMAKKRVSLPFIKKSLKLSLFQDFKKAI